MESCGVFNSRKSEASVAPTPIKPCNANYRELFRFFLNFIIFLDCNKLKQELLD